MFKKIIVSFICLAPLAYGQVEYLWKGGHGVWSSPSAWTPAGGPGAMDYALFPAHQTQNVQITTDTSVQRIHTDNSDNGAFVQTFTISPGATLSADGMRSHSSFPADILITGGGTLALNNRPFTVGYRENPVKFTVTGPGTTFSMPKASSSGLCIGSSDSRSVDNLFRVSNCATALVANAVALGQYYDIDSGNSPMIAGGGMLIEEGAHIDCGLILLIGRDVVATSTTKCYCAITNASLAVDSIDFENGPYATFTASNAVINARTRFWFPTETATHPNHQRVDICDSVVTTPSFRVLMGGSNMTGRLDRCTLNTDNITAGHNTSRDSLFTIEDSTLNVKNITTGKNGHPNGTNNVLRVVNTTVNTTQPTILGCTFGAMNICYEQIGGKLNTSVVLIGKYDSYKCGGIFRGVDLASGEFIVGDARTGTDTNRAWKCYAEIADMEFKPTNLMVGVASIETSLLITNSTVNAGLTGKVMTVGRDPGATSNSMEVVDSTFTQTGGDLYVGRYNGCSSSVLRIKNSTYTLATTNNKGDIMVGVEAGAVYNSLELDNSTLSYDRRWMAVGHNGSFNTWKMGNGSTLNASSSQFWLGSASGTSNKLEMVGTSTLDVSLLGMKNKAVASFSGAGNVVRVGSEGFSVEDYCSFNFTPSEDATETPVLTINKPFYYGALKQAHIDVTGLPIGTYKLVTSSDALNKPVRDSNVTVTGAVPGQVAVPLLSADSKTLLVTVANAGTVLVLE